MSRVEEYTGETAFDRMEKEAVELNRLTLHDSVIHPRYRENYSIWNSTPEQWHFTKDEVLKALHFQLLIDLSPALCITLNRNAEEIKDWITRSEEERFWNEMGGLEVLG